MKLEKKNMAYFNHKKYVKNLAILTLNSSKIPKYEYKSANLCFFYSLSISKLRERKKINQNELKFPNFPAE